MSFVHALPGFKLAEPDMTCPCGRWNHYLFDYFCQRLNCVDVSKSGIPDEAAVRERVRHSIGDCHHQRIAIAVKRRAENLFAAAQAAVVGLRSGGTRTGPLSALNLEQLGLTGMRADLSDLAQRDPNFMTFRNLEDASARGPSVEVPSP